MTSDRKRAVYSLRRRFPRLSAHEIEQELAMAEVLTDEFRLVWTIAKRRLIDGLRRESAIAAKFDSYDAPWFDEDLLRCDGDLLLERYFSDDEWSSVAAGLPYPAQKLAAIARRQAELFEDVPGGIWTSQNLTELRRRIKREFVAWDRDHSERAYFRARQTLVTALHRHRKRRA